MDVAVKEDGVEVAALEAEADAGAVRDNKPHDDIRDNNDDGSTCDSVRDSNARDNDGRAGDVRGAVSDAAD
jgi:hypothetical protein